MFRRSIKRFVIWLGLFPLFNWVWFTVVKRQSMVKPENYALVRHLQERHQFRTFVETGTYLGDMTAQAAALFDQVISIEIDPKLYRRAQRRFRSQPHIVLHLGDSSQVLSQLVEDIHTPTLFWLDAHFADGITGKGDLYTPISTELDTIFSHWVPGHIVLVDDANKFDGTEDYPTESALAACVERAPLPLHLQLHDNVYIISELAK